jgi:hypothetical protein
VVSLPPAALALLLADYAASVDERVRGFGAWVGAVPRGLRMPDVKWAALSFGAQV